MSRIFIAIYDYLDRHRLLFWLFLTGSFAFFAWGAAQVKFEENINSFFPDTRDAGRISAVFDHLKVKDKIVLLYTSADSLHPVSPDRLIEVGGRLEEELSRKAGPLVKEIFSKAGTTTVTEVTDFVYGHLPLFIPEEAYAGLDSLLQPDAVEQKIRTGFRNLLSPAGTVMKDWWMKDPLGLGTPVLMKLKEAQPALNYEIYGESIFAAGLKMRLAFITPLYGTGSTGKNEELISVLEETIAEMQYLAPDVKTEYFGGPSVAVYNARQIKRDTLITLNIALLIIVVFITLVFRRKAAVPLILVPVAFGAVFSLCLMAWIQGSVSGIAIGAGAAVFGVALSYSIHMLTHAAHVRSPHQLIRELAYPLTVGSFTTIGAFFGLTFTQSDLLRDFGLFASLALVGTTLFCLIFLPHFLKVTGKHSSGGLLRKIGHFNGYAFDRNKWLIGGILILTGICCFTSGWVEFDSDMMHLNFEPPHLKASEARLRDMSPAGQKTVLFVTTGKDWNEGLTAYRRINAELRELQFAGTVGRVVSMEDLLIAPQVQQQRLRAWQNFWTDARKEQLRRQVTECARKYHFREDAFRDFFALLDREYGIYDYGTAGTATPRLLEEWVSAADSLVMLVTQISISTEVRDSVYQPFLQDEQLVIFDRAYFANQWVSTINDDFYLVLFISSFLIFFALLISYGRIELTLITFTPMTVSWIIIVGLMGIFGIPFHIVSIILSTFIFGLGDDFSIFIMDGLLQEYRTGKKMLVPHKTAIFFSAFTTIVGMGALAFARHPALQSISWLSVFGMLAVVLVAYTIQPVLFRLFISGPVAKGGFPYTLSSLLMTVWAFSLFVTGCGILQGIIPLLLLAPVSARRKKRWFHVLVCYFLKGFMKLMFNVKQEYRNPGRERFDKPAVVIANHQSFVDILVLLSLSPRLVMVTNNWVWNSPFFGRIVRYGDCFNTAGGYEKLAEELRKKVAEGYSVVVFPEGTRSADCRLKRFHKGAFWLAEQLQLDILPVVLYGNGMVVSKRQPFYVKTGWIASEILPRIAWEDRNWGNTYRERQKSIALFFRDAYERISREFAVPENSWYYNRLIKNYIYKGPVEEWYVRVKVKLERRYAFFNRLIPRKAKITDIGCGFGMLDYMLAMLSEERTVLGIDYDEDKIAVAAHGFLRNENVRFVAADVLNYELPDSDVFILNDMLHYLEYPQQERLVLTCAARLKAGGMILIRDGDNRREKRHRLTRLTEFFSTRIFRFNKTKCDLCFISHGQMLAIATRGGMRAETVENDKYTSNTIYILRKQTDKNSQHGGTV